MHRVVRIESAIDDDKKGQPAYVFTTTEGSQFEAFPGQLARESLHSREQLAQFRHSVKGNP